MNAHSSEIGSTVGAEIDPLANFIKIKLPSMLNRRTADPFANFFKIKLPSMLKHGTADGSNVGTDQSVRKNSFCILLEIFNKIIFFCFKLQLNHNSTEHGSKVGTEIDP